MAGCTGTRERILATALRNLARSTASVGNFLSTVFRVGLHSEYEIRWKFIKQREQYAVRHC